MASDLELLKRLLEQLQWFGALGVKDEDVERVIRKVRERIQRVEAQQTPRKQAG